MKGINDRGLRIGPGQPLFIIVEAGINHEGDVKVAFDLVDAAATTGANAVKFQTFRTENVMTRQAPKANYHIETTGDDKALSWFDLIKQEELRPEDFRAIKKRCDEKGIMFLSTPYDEVSVDLLIDIGVPAIKIASTDANNLPFLAYVGAKKWPVIYSTGMLTLAEVKAGVKTLRDAGCKDLVVMHCTAEYPAPIEEANLRAMSAIAEACDVAIGYSDHVPEFTAAIAALGLGACCYERHFTIDKTAFGPDHRASSDPDEFRELIRVLRRAEIALGDGVKKPTASELRNRPIMTRFVVAARAIPAGAVLARVDFGIKRTGGVGYTPDRLAALIGRKAARAIAADEPFVDGMAI